MLDDVELPKWKIVTYQFLMPRPHTDHQYIICFFHEGTQEIQFHKERLLSSVQLVYLSRQVNVFLRET
jgi:hypothetical protein